MKPSLIASKRYLELHERYLIQAPAKAEFKEYKRLDRQFALLKWNISAVMNFVRKETEQCEA